MTFTPYRPLTFRTMREGRASDLITATNAYLDDSIKRARPRAYPVNRPADGEGAEQRWEGVRIAAVLFKQWLGEVRASNDSTADSEALEAFTHRVLTYALDSETTDEFRAGFGEARASLYAFLRAGL